MKPAADIIAELQALTDFIRKAEEETRQMKEVNLGDLDLKVSTLCEEAKNLQGEDSASVQEPMMDMIRGLEALAEALKEASDKEDKAES